MGAMNNLAGYAVSMLHQKASSGDVDYLRGLEEGEATYRLLQERDRLGNTALHWASRFGHAEFVDGILGRCRSINTTSCSFFELLRIANQAGDTAAHEAIRHSHARVAMKLLGEDTAGRMSSLVNHNSESLLYLAAERGLQEVVERLLHQAADQSKYDGPRGTTALHAAIKSGPRSGAAVVKLLLKERPDLNEKADHRGDLPLHHAAYMGDEEMVSALLPLNGKSSSSTGNYEGCVNVLELLCRGNNDGNTPIHMAAMAGNLPVLRAIMEAHPDAGAIVNNQGRNTLHLAVAFQRADVVEYLLRDPGVKRRFNLAYQRDVGGNGPLHVAALHCSSLRILRLLLADPGVDNLGRNQIGQTASDVFYSMVEPQPTLHWYEAKLLLKRAIPHVHQLPGNYEQNEKESMNRKLQLRRKAEMEIQSQVEEQRGRVFVVAILIAAIAFAAAFTVPAGSRSSTAAQGAGVLHLVPMALDVVASTVFVVSNMVALSSSLASIFLCVYAAWDTISSVLPYWTAIRLLMKFSLMGISVAFASGMFVIPATSWVLWLTVLACTMSGKLPLVIHMWIKPEPLKAAAHHLSEGISPATGPSNNNNDIAQTTTTTSLATQNKEPMHVPGEQEATTAAPDDAKTTSTLTPGLADQPLTDRTE